MLFHQTRHKAKQINKNIIAFSDNFTTNNFAVCI